MSDAEPVRTSVQVEAGPVTAFELRLHDPSAAVIDSLSARFCISWPLQPNTLAGEGPRVLCLGPREWLILNGDPQDIEDRVRGSCRDVLHHLANVSAGRRLFEVTGRDAESLLASGCSLDLHGPRFRPNTCARTLLAQVTVVLIRLHSGGKDQWQAIADVSVGDYLTGWFTDSAKAL